MSKNVLIVNQHSSNFGDDAAGSALIQMLIGNNEVRRVSIIYNAEKEIPINDAKVFHESDIKFRTAGHFNVLWYFLIRRPLGLRPKGEILQKWIDLIHSSDVIFIAPCGANIGIYKDWNFLLRVLMVVLEHKTPVFHYNTIGKSGGFFFDAISKYVLKRSIIYVRERKSEDYINKLGINCRWGPDTAFALNKCDELVRRGVVSFVPSSLSDWHPSYKSNSDEIILKTILTPIASWIEKNNLILEILPHLCSEKERENNLHIVELLRALNVKNVIIRNDVNDMWDYDKCISSSQFVIAMRYHTAVLAAKNNRPFLALCYENKMQELCTYTNCEKLSVNLLNIDDNSSYQIQQILDFMIDNENDIISTIKKSLDKILPLIKIPIEEQI